MPDPTSDQSPSTYLSAKLDQIEEDRVFQVVAEVQAQRALGQTIADAVVIARYPELMPRLAVELATAGKIRQAQLAAARAGTLDHSLTPLELNQLEAPLHLISNDIPPGTQLPAVCIKGYTDIVPIGEGGQAVVYRGVQEVTGRKVAIKVLNGGQFVHSASRVRFEREVTLLATLNHPHIVSIIDRGRTNEGAFYLVMELIEGLPLHEYFAQRQPLDVQEVVDTFIKITKALAEAHRQGIIHRDIKPQNIRMDQHGEPHLLDFGLARSITERVDIGITSPTITLPNQIMGSIPWSSPEQINGGTIDQRSDIYSLGFIFYYILRGSFPFAVRNLPESIENIAHARPAPLHSSYPALDAIVMRCIEKNPTHRYSSAEELLYDLERARELRVPTWPHSVWPWIWRTGAVAVLMVLVLLLVYGISSILNKTSRSASPTPISNSVGMELIFIRYGFFTMGSPLKEPGRSESESPHPVELTKDFYLGRTEITQRQYCSVMGIRTPTSAPAEQDRAVGNVSWQDAQEFCRRLSLKEKRTYRLPTEAEWEYACRAGTTDAYGNQRPEDVGWFGLSTTSPLPAVATKRPNAWGLFDMHGGVSEWCQDGLQPYSKGSVQNPLGSANSLKIIRGGNYYSLPEQCRAAARQKADLLTREPYIGFRVVLEIP